MFCRNCGKEFPDSATHCDVCGHPSRTTNKTNSASEYSKWEQGNQHSSQPASDYRPTPYIPPPEPTYSSAPYNPNYSGAPYEQQMDDGLAFLLYVISFILPLAGFIIGAIYISKEEEHYRRVGRTCLSLGLLSIVIGFLISMIFFAAVVSTI